MADNTVVKSFRLVPMSPVILTIAVVLLALPSALVLGTLSGGHFLSFSALIVAIVYVWVWLRFRPSRFVIRDRTIEILWPLKGLQISRAEIARVQFLDKDGLWGGFGWFWTQRRGIVHMHISRADGFVWIERKNGRPWLIAPEHPQKFVTTILSGEKEDTENPGGL